MLEDNRTFIMKIPNIKGIWGFAGMLAGLDGSSGYFERKGLIGYLNNFYCHHNCYKPKTNHKETQIVECGVYLLFAIQLLNLLEL
jgi:hypothetical protein